MRVKVIDKKTGREKEMPERFAKVLTQMGRATYLTRDMAAAPVAPVSAPAPAPVAAPVPAEAVSEPKPAAPAPAAAPAQQQTQPKTAAPAKKTGKGKPGRKAKAS